MTSDIRELKPRHKLLRLILRVANIHYEEAIVQWLFELYREGREGLEVQLHQCNKGTISLLQTKYFTRGERTVEDC